MDKRKIDVLKAINNAKNGRGPIMVLNPEDLKNKIYIIRGVRVILDRDLAELYSIETRALKQAVNRNKKRFPLDFMFIMTENEVDIMVSQNVIPSRMHLGGALPYAFTEQGIANLSSVLNSDKAIEVNIQIMRAFVAMRKFISTNAEIFRRLDTVERKQLESQITTDKNFERVFEAIEDKEFIKKQGIFFDGQIFDAYAFVSDLVRSAQKSIVLIDNFVDDSVLTLFSKRKDDVRVVIYTKNITKQLRLDLEKYNAQYQSIELIEFEKSHDRFMIIDSDVVYHIGASLKDLGKRWFAFSKFDKGAFGLQDKLGL